MKGRVNLFSYFVISADADEDRQPLLMSDDEDDESEEESDDEGELGNFVYLSMELVLNDNFSSSCES